MNAKQRLRTLLLVSLLLFVMVALVGAAGTPAVDWHVISSGGGHAEAGNYTLDSTIGQALAGEADAGPFHLCSGFECGADVEHRVYLPLVLRVSP